MYRDTIHLCTMSDHRDSTDFTALAEFRFQLRKFLAISADAAKEAGIDPTQHQLLLVIKGRESESVNVGDIAERLMIRHNSAVELVSRTERNGWVERIRDDNDRRLVHVQLTSKGESMLEALSAVHLRELKSAGPNLINTMNTILKRIPDFE